MAGNTSDNKGQQPHEVQDFGAAHDDAHNASHDGQHVVITLCDGIYFEHLTGDIYQVRLERTHIPNVAPHMVRALMHSGELSMPVSGVLLNVQSVTQLSVVRLASFLDALSVLTPVIAVVFRDQAHSRLADVLHNTLVNKDSIAYFIDRHAALLYLTLSL